MDDVPAGLRRRLFGTIPYVPQVRTRESDTSLEPLPELRDDEEGEGDAEVEAPEDNSDTSSGFMVYIALDDGFLAGITLSGRSSEV